MLISSPTKFNAGITLYGDYNDLKSLHATVCFLADRNPLAGRLEEFILAFAYGIRNAYEGDSSVVEFIDMGLGPERYFSVSFLWPYFLIYVGMLRWAAAYNPTTREIQADLYRLEACTEKALVKADLKSGQKCIEWLATFGDFLPDYLEQYIEDCCIDYLSIGKPGIARFKKLPALLLTISPFSKKYTEFTERLEQIARFQKCSPKDLRNTADWPDFEW